MTLSEFPSPPLDAVRILRREHEVLRRMFLTFTRVRQDGSERGREGDIVGRICLGLSLHERAEHEVVIPALLALPRGASAVRQLSAGHALVGALIAQLDELEPGDPGHHAAMAALSGCASGHFAEEESGLFPHLSGLDTETIALAMVSRQRQWRVDTMRAAPYRVHDSDQAWPATCHVVDDWSPPDAFSPAPTPPRHD